MNNEEIILVQINNLIKDIQGLRTGVKALYTNQEMLKLLDVTSATLKKWRDNGYIGYSLVGSTYYYSAKDLEEFLDRNHYDAYAYQ